MTLIGDQIRVARTLAHIDQHELGRRVGVSKSTISNWENGRGEPSITEWAAIARATGAEWMLDLTRLPTDTMQLSLPFRHLTLAG